MWLQLRFFNLKMFIYLIIHACYKETYKKNEKKALSPKVNNRCYEMDAEFARYVLEELYIYVERMHLRDR